MKNTREEIKSLAQELGIPVTDLLAMSPKNDPFYVGSPSDWMVAKWFQDYVWIPAGFDKVCRRGGTIHLRRAHYWAVTKAVKKPDGANYENTDHDWKVLTQSAKMARYLGLIPIENIHDNKNPDPIINANYEDRVDPLTPDFRVEPEAYVVGPDGCVFQPFHLEVWCEKGTMNDVLEPLCKSYHANLCTFQGEASVTAVYQAARRIEQAKKDAVILYVSDFDAAGKSMPCAVARKLEYMLKRYDIEHRCRVIAVALTEGQVSEYDLPRTPMKESEKRAAAFESAFGEGAVELDALEAIYPGALHEIVEGVLTDHFDHDVEDEYKDHVRSLLRRAEEVLAEASDQEREALDAITATAERLMDGEIREPRSADEPDYDEDPAYLFDSDRDMQDQIACYRKHKGRSKEDE